MSENAKRPDESEMEYLARLAAQVQARRDKGRSALLNQAEDYDPDDAEDGADDDGDAGGGGGGGDDDDDAPKFDHVRMPRFFGRNVRQVPISMPDDAPITCLGRSGKIYWYLDPTGQLVGLQDSEHGQAHITGVWAPQINLLHRSFPQFDQNRTFKGFQAQYARDAMMAACANKGIFDAHEQVRGRGCWKDDNGNLVQHLGDRVLAGGTSHKPGEIGGYVYPGRPPLPAPKLGGLQDCEAIYARFQLWNFARGEVDARLLMGQLAAGVLGAALSWRPMAFITGDAGTGKSTLQQYCRDMLGHRIISTVDATEAALRNLLGQDSLMVSFDEIEADAHNDKAQTVLKLARTSASGDSAHRSSSDQVARSFTLRGSFLFSAIIPPSMRNQDMQRFAFLRLQTLKSGAKLPILTQAELRDLGAGLVGRITEGWPRWERTLQMFFQSLQQRGHEHRGAMQFGTMLAAAHILLHDEDPTDDDVAQWTDKLKRETLFEYENSEPAWLQAWRTIMTAHPEAWRGEGSPTVAEMIRRYLLAAGAPDGDENRRVAHDKLTRAGLAIVKQRGTGRLFLAIPPRHSGIAAIFRGSDFQKSGGEGAWNTPLRGAPKVDGDRGVLLVEKVPRLERQKCALFWLDGTAVVAGETINIFERKNIEDEIEASAEERLPLYRAALARAETRAELEGLRAKASALLEVWEREDPPGLEDVEAFFNTRWGELPA